MCSNRWANPVLPGLLVLRADLVIEVDGRDGRLVVLVQQDRQAVGQGVPLDLQLGDLGLPRFLAADLTSPGQEPAAEHQPDPALALLSIEAIPP